MTAGIDDWTDGSRFRLIAIEFGYWPNWITWGRVKRLEYLDLLRGAAACLVVVQHAFETIRNAGYSVALLEYINLGRFGVMLFFLISGFVIPLSFRGADPVRGFLISRALRIYPALWLSVAVYVALAPTADMFRIVANMSGYPIWLGQAPFLGAYWSLAFELSFYAACLVLYVKGWLMDTHLIGLLTIELAFFGLWSEVPFCFAMLFIGSLLRQAIFEHNRTARKYLMLALPVLSLGQAWLAIQLAPGSGLSVAAHLAGNLLPIPVFALALWRPYAAPGWAVYLGSISYSVYLLQGVMLVSVTSVLNRAGPVAYLCAVLGGTILLASVSCFLVERPAIALGKGLRRNPLRA